MVHICKTTVVVKYMSCSTVFKKKEIFYIFVFSLGYCFEHVVPWLLHHF